MSTIFPDCDAILCELYLFCNILYFSAIKFLKSDTFTEKRSAMRSVPFVSAFAERKAKYDEQ